MVDRRRMVRDYAETPVDPAVVERALRNATHAPSAGFSQGWGFLVLDTPADVRRYWRATAPDRLPEPDRWLTGMMRAPVVIVPCSSEAAYRERYAEPDKRGHDWPVPYWHLDTAMAALLVLLTAVDEGLGACFFGIPSDRLDTVRAEFGIDAAYEPIGAITLGHRTRATGAQGSPARRGRKPLDQVVHRGDWGS